MKNIGLYIICLFLFACNRYDKPVPDAAPSVYFWRTTLDLDKEEISFLRTHGIKKMYVRFFDVELDNQGLPAPVGTIAFLHSVPRGIKIIPVVYVEYTCLKQPDTLAAKIVKRVLAMGDTNDVPIDELQIDCDWTKHTQKNYFELLRAVKRGLQGRRLSVTVRLHQLALDVPPADYGVLMCYNTGNLRSYDSCNPILDIKDVKPFAKYVSKYSLPLCVAYPVFSWNLLFENRQFRAILRDVNLGDSTNYRKLSPKLYQVVRSHSVPSPDLNSFGMMLRRGDEIKVDEVATADILKINSMLAKKRPSLDKQVVLYSLNAKDLNKYKPYEIKKIYCR